MKIRSFSYFIKEAFISLVRNRLMAIASIITVMSCIFILSFSYCVAINIDYMLEQLESSVNFSVYVKEDFPPDKLKELNTKIQSIDAVKEVTYISSDQALEIFRKTLGDDDQHLLDGLKEDNPMPRSFSVELTDVSRQKEVIAELEKLKDFGVDEVHYDQQVFDTLTSLNTGIRVVSILAILALIAVSVVIIINTIKITVNSRKTEIVIMKHIGATDWFVRWPFIFEGILIGFFGSFFPTLISWLTYDKSISTIYNQFKMLENLVNFRSSSYVFLGLMPLSLFIGIAIGVFGSLTSLRRYLKA